MGNKFITPEAKVYSYKEFLDSTGYLIFTSVGTSMLPLLRQQRDIIEIKRKESEKYRKYEVILYKRGEKYILHRILRVLPTGYLIAGDHNTFVEKDVTDDMILGVMTRVIRNGKSITPDNFFYKVYVHLWCDCYPVRMLILKIKQRIRKILSRIREE